MTQLSADDYVRNIQNAQITIHTRIQVGDPNFWIPDEFLEELLNRKLVGLNVNYPIRTRSKIVKQAVCSALGYPVEKTFPKCQPRFTGQNFDTYNQQSSNLQIWNEEVSPQRRYVIIGINSQNVIFKVKVISGYELALLDTTGTITKKHQASFIPSPTANLELISSSDSFVSSCALLCELFFFFLSRFSKTSSFNSLFLFFRIFLNIRKSSISLSWLKAGKCNGRVKPLVTNVSNCLFVIFNSDSKFETISFRKNMNS